VAKDFIDFSHNEEGGMRKTVYMLEGPVEAEAMKFSNL
jgi:hypothetical protein